MSALFFLSCGVMDIPAWLTHPAGQRRGLCRESVAVAVRVGPDGDVLLMDAGFSRRTCANPAAKLGFFMSRTLGVRLGQGDAIADQLQALGISADRVRTIVATHLHLDHVGGAVDFPGAEVVCSRREWEAFHTVRWPPGAYRAADLESAQVRPVDLDGPPFLGFPASHDLGGDGSVVLLDSRGHTRGHVAVALRDGEGWVIHTGDASDHLWEYQRVPPSPSLQARVLAWSREDLVRTHGAMRACAALPVPTRFVPTHEWAVYEREPHGPP